MDKDQSLLSTKIRQLSKALQETTVNGQSNLRDLASVYVHLIRNQLAGYYVGLYSMVSPDVIRQNWGPEAIDYGQEWYVLLAGTGTSGDSIARRGTLFLVGEGSVVGRSLKKRQAQIFDVDDYSQRFLHPELPEACSIIVLPLVEQQGQLVGAVEIQSVQVAAFSDDDIPLLQPITDQLAGILATILSHDQT